MHELNPVQAVTIAGLTGTRLSGAPIERLYRADEVDALLSAIGAGGVQPLAGAAQQQGKALDDPRLQELFMSTICGAMAFGYQDTNPPPPGHWLQQAWDIGRAEAKRLKLATYAWAVSGMTSPFFGEFAQEDAQAEARRIGGDAVAFPLVAFQPDPAQIGFCDTDPEADYIEQSRHLNCPACGGSGHVGDVVAQEQVEPALHQAVYVVWSESGHCIMWTHDRTRAEAVAENYKRPVTVYTANQPADQAQAEQVQSDPLWPIDGIYPDMQPPATARDRWMYDQGRLAERRHSDQARSELLTAAPIKIEVFRGVIATETNEDEAWTQPVEPEEDAPGEAGLRWAIGRALSDAFGSVGEDGVVAIDPFDADNITPLVDAVTRVLAERQPPGIEAEIRADERERICTAIKAEDDYCVTEGDYMLDSDDCIAVVRGEWVRPDYSVGPTGSEA